jgi:predicted kinase
MKMIVAVFGLPGSGKTFLAAQLAVRIKGPHISSDIVRQTMFQNGQYDEQSKLEVYQKMFAMAETAHRKQKPVVMDATFFKAQVRQLLQEKAVQWHTPLYFIEVRASEQVIKQRLREKRPDSDADFQVYLTIKQAFEPLNEAHLILYSDTEKLSDMLHKALEYICYTHETGRN